MHTSAAWVAWAAWICSFGSLRTRRLARNYASSQRQTIENRRGGNLAAVFLLANLRSVLNLRRRRIRNACRRQHRQDALKPLRIFQGHDRGDPSPAQS